jgi:hypothetical protein
MKGPNLDDLSKELLVDLRTRYVIYNRQIFNVERGDTAWRPYDGVNAHEKHLHISVSLLPALFDDAMVWAIGDREMLTRGQSNAYVRKMQVWLRTCGFALVNDGFFGPGTELAVKVFQRLTYLPVTGIYDTYVTAPQLAARVESVRNRTVQEFSREQINQAKKDVETVG